MQILMIRTDLDGGQSWETYSTDGYTLGSLLPDILAHLNTLGVRKLELIPSQEMDIRGLKIGRLRSEETLETVAKEMFPAEYEAIDDDHPMDPWKVRAAEAELARRKKSSGETLDKTEVQGIHSES